MIYKNSVDIRSSRRIFWPIANTLICISVTGIYLVLTKRLERLSFRFFYDAIPAALTNIANNKTGLTSSPRVQLFFQDRIPNLTDSDLVIGLRLAEFMGAHDEQTRVFLGDDLGLPHFVQLAFSIFGLHVWSIHLLFAALFASTTLLVVWCFPRECWVQFSLLAYQLSFALMTPNLFVSSQLWTWTDPRAISILAVSPSIFLIAFAFHSRQRNFTLLILLIQLLVLAFVIYVRFAAIWAVMGSFGATLILAVFDRRPKMLFWMPVAKSAAAVCGVLLMSFLLANLAVGSLKLTNSDRAPARHLFWHSVVTSESLGDIGQSRGQIFDDASTHELVRSFLIEKGESSTVKKVFGEGIAPGDYSQVDWRAYEDSAKALFFRDVQENPGELIQFMLIEKPVLWLQSFSWFVGAHWGDSRSILEQQLGFPAPSSHLRLIRTFVFLASFGMLLGIMILKTSQETFAVSVTKSLVVLVSLFVASLLPAIGLIPLAHVISDSVILAFALVIGLATFFVAFCLS